MTATPGVRVVFNSGIGSLFCAVETASAAVAGASRVVSVYGVGTFEGPLNDFEPDPMSLTFSFTQTGGGTGGDVSGWFSMTSPVPEPMSLALLSLGLAGLGVAMRRKA